MVHDNEHPIPVPSRSTVSRAPSRRRRTRSIAVVATVASLALLGAACGSDDEAEDTTTTAADSGDSGGGGEVDEAAFCDTYVEIDGVIATAFTGGDTSGIPDLTATLEENAPEEITDDVAAAAAAANAIAEDPESEGPEGGEEAQQAVLDWVSDNCGFETMSVKAMNYHYMGIPDTTDSGKYVVDLTNNALKTRLLRSTLRAIPLPPIEGFVTDIGFTSSLAA